MKPEQRDVLAHVVADPDAWWRHAVATFGEGPAVLHLEAKVARHRAEYTKAAAQPGYKPRAEREPEALSHQRAHQEHVATLAARRRAAGKA